MTHSHPPHQEDLPEIIEEARAALSEHEFERTLHEGEEEGGRAAVRESVRWLVCLLLGAGVVAAIAVDWIILVPTAALMILYSIPLIVAADSNSADDAEAEVLLHHVESPDEPVHELEPQVAPAATQRGSAAAAPGRAAAERASGA